MNQGRASDLETSLTADRVLELLGLMAQAGDSLGVTEAAQQLGVSRPAAHRLLRSLLTSGFAVQDASRRYRLGPKVVLLAQKYVNAVDARQEYAPLLEEIRDLTGETVSLILRVGKQRISIAHASSKHPIAHIPKRGHSAPVTRGAPGRALLSTEPPPVRARLWGEFADLSQLTLESFEAKINRGIEMGYFVGLSENIPDMNLAAVPLIDANGVAVAVVSITGPGYRWTLTRINECMPAVIDAIDAFNASHFMLIDSIALADKLA